jgi:hypothetical protein
VSTPVDNVRSELESPVPSERPPRRHAVAASHLRTFDHRPEKLRVESRRRSSLPVARVECRRSGTASEDAYAGEEGREAREIVDVAREHGVTADCGGCHDERIDHDAALERSLRLR